MSQENPIPNGWHWNEAELPADDSLFSGLVTLMVIGHDLAPKLIGTAFLVTAEGYKATAISAAHCFSFAERIIHPEKKHHATTPSEFLPPPTEVDLKQVKAIYQRAGRIFVCPVELAIWDSATDLAVLTIVAPSDDPKLFENFFWIDNELPNVGDLVCMIGFGDLSEEHPPQQGIMRRRLVLRVGHVEQISHEPSQLLKSPSVRTSIAVYGGMSGGLVAKYSSGHNIKPFAFVSHAPDPQPTLDRSISGHSTASVLKAKLTPISEGKQLVEIEVNDVRIGRTNPSDVDVDSPDQ